MPRRRRVQNGEGLWDSIKSGLSSANDWLRKTKAVSKAAGALSGVVPGAERLSSVAGKLGYGKKKRAGRKPGPKKMTGAGRKVLKL